MTALRQDMPLLDVQAGDIISLHTTVAWEIGTDEPAALDLIGRPGVESFSGTLTGTLLSISSINNGAGFQIFLDVPGERVYRVRTSRYNRSARKV
ncbi:MAG: hypothetical protein ACOH1Y_11755 [Propionicimonas sp.]